MIVIIHSGYHVLCFFFIVGLPRPLGASGALPDSSVEATDMPMPPAPTRPPAQKRRKPGRKKSKPSWSQKDTTSTEVVQTDQPGNGPEPVKIPKKRGPKPGSKVHYGTSKMDQLLLVVNYESFQS